MSFSSEAPFAGSDDGLRPVLHPDLVEDARNVVADGLLRHAELRRYLRIIQTACNALQDFGFAGREVGESMRARRGLRREEGAQLIEEHAKCGLVLEENVILGFERQ